MYQLHWISPAFCGQPVPELERYMDTLNSKTSSISKMVKDVNDKINPATAESQQFLI